MSKENEILSKKFLQSYIYTDKGNYFLSTGYRRSSAALNPDAWYYEMYCWELNDKNERGDIVYQDYANYQKKAIKQHYLYIKKLLKNTKDR